MQIRARTESYRLATVGKNELAKDATAETLLLTPVEELKAAGGVPAENGPAAETKEIRIVVPSVPTTTTTGDGKEKKKAAKSRGKKREEDLAELKKEMRMVSEFWLNGMDGFEN